MPQSPLKGPYYVQNPMLTPQRAFLREDFRQTVLGLDERYGAPVTYSFTDAQASVILPFNVIEGKLVNLPGLVLFSASEHRDTYPVVSTMRHTKGMTTGHIVYAGTLAFDVLGESPFMPIIRRYAAWIGQSQQSAYITATDIPPFSLLVVFQGQFGNTAVCRLDGVKIVDVARNVSVRDIQLSEVYSFMASRYVNLVDITAEHKISSNPEGPFGYRGYFGDLSTLQTRMGGILTEPSDKNLIDEVSKLKKAHGLIVGDTELEPEGWDEVPESTEPPPPPPEIEVLD